MELCSRQHGPKPSAGNVEAGEEISHDATKWGGGAARLYFKHKELRDGIVPENLSKYHERKVDFTVVFFFLCLWCSQMFAVTVQSPCRVFDILSFSQPAGKATVSRLWSTHTYSSHTGANNARLIISLCCVWMQPGTLRLFTDICLKSELNKSSRLKAPRGERSTRSHFPKRKWFTLRQNLHIKIPKVCEIPSSPI